MTTRAASAIHVISKRELKSDVQRVETTARPASVLSSSQLQRVRIQSWSAITPLGDLAQTWQALLDGQAIRDHARSPIDPTFADDRGFGLARAAVRDLIDSDATIGDDKGAVALIVGTSKGPIERWLTPPSTSDNTQRPIVQLEGLGDIASRLAREFNIEGPHLTISAACASGLHALCRGLMMIGSGQCTRAIVVATESSLHPLFVGSFRRLGVLAKPGEGARPFDRNRQGFFMSEAAAAVMLEADDSSEAIRVKDSPRVYVDRFALGGDAIHLTGTDPAGATLRRLISNVLDRRPVDLVHAHGTGTVQNDASELAALQAVLSDDRSLGRAPIIYSHKAALGHSLGASGLLSVVLNCQAHATSRVPGNVHTLDPMPAERLLIPAGNTSRSISRSLVIATGFGGPTAVVSLSNQPAKSE